MLAHLRTIFKRTGDFRAKCCLIMILLFHSSPHAFTSLILLLLCSRHLEKDATDDFYENIAQNTVNWVKFFTFKHLKVITPKMTFLE